MSRLAVAQSDLVAIDAVHRVVLDHSDLLDPQVDVLIERLPVDDFLRTKQPKHMQHRSPTDQKLELEVLTCKQPFDSEAIEKSFQNIHSSPALQLVLEELGKQS